MIGAINAPLLKHSATWAINLSNCALISAADAVHGGERMACLDNNCLVDHFPMDG
jgi:hypothetical protein